VYIGASKAPGIALGHKQSEMMVKFIPKWHNIEVGEKVFTSGLDDIFFANIPVGIVSKVEVQSSYTVAHIKTYSDIFHPKTFFLIYNSTPTLTEDFQGKNSSIPSIPMVSSIPHRIDQIQEKPIEAEKKDEKKPTEAH
jgi:rod shape-determining protein MreC